MGAWSTAIFSDDIAADTRDAFTDMVGEGLTAVAATKRLVDESAELLEDDEDANVFWLALAATQWKLGRLQNRVRDRAIKIIDSEADLRRWKDNSKVEFNQRKTHLAKLRDQLLCAQPKPKRIKPPIKSSTDFKPGDVAVFRVNDLVGVRFCVLDLWADRGGTYTKICLLGLDDGKSFRKKRLRVSDMLGPCYTMLYHEPRNGVTILRRSVELPELTAAVYKAWNSRPVHGHACRWDNFPEVLRTALPKLGWS